MNKYFEKVATNYSNVLSEVMHIADRNGHRFMSPTQSYRSLGIDSLEIVEFAMALEDHFNVDIPDTMLKTLDTPDKVARYITTHIH